MEMKIKLLTSLIKLKEMEKFQNVTTLKGAIPCISLSRLERG